MPTKPIASKLGLSGLILAATAWCLPAYAQAPESNDPIKIALFDWTSVNLNAKIMGGILEKLGYTVEYPTADYLSSLTTGLTNGDLTLAMEFWDTTAGEAMKASDATGQTEKLGPYADANPPHAALPSDASDLWLVPAERSSARSSGCRSLVISRRNNASQRFGSARLSSSALLAEQTLQEALGSLWLGRLGLWLRPGSVDRLVQRPGDGRSLPAMPRAPRERTRAEAQAGGLSGAPLTLRAREVVAHVAGRTDLPVIGVGGVMTGADARALVDAGADLVQLYTGLVYAGPTLVADAVESTARPGQSGRTAS